MAREENNLWVAEYYNPEGDKQWRQWNWNASGSLDEVIGIMIAARWAYRRSSNYNWRLRNLATDDIIPAEAIVD